MDTDRVNVAELCAGLGIHYNEQDTDVTIECEGQKYLCHCAALTARSVYFENMFNNNTWTENVTGTIVLANERVKAAALLKVLKYLYTGDVTILASSGNFIDLLHACNYLNVREWEKLSIGMMLRDRPDPIVDLVEVAFFAHSVSNQLIIDMLAGCNITEHLKKYFQTEEFLETSADLLGIIVSTLWRSPPTANNILRRAINRWKLYAPEERAEHALRLYKVLEQRTKILLDDSVGSLDSLVDFRPNLLKTVAATPNPSFYVYMEEEEDYRMKINYRMKIYRYNGMNLRSKKFGFETSFVENSKIRAPRFVSVDNVGVFSIAYDAEENNYPVFTQFASAYICRSEHGLALASPPVNLFRTFDFCNLSNRGLYLLPRIATNETREQLSNPRYDSSKQEFSNDEIQRGIYFYNIELDRWFPVPAMRRRPCDSCMTIQDNIVYVISSHMYRKMVQAYDHRERQWQRKLDALQIHTNAQSCVLDGKIYVSSNRSCERYDPIAGKWEDIGRGLITSRFGVQRLIPYNNQLWQFRRLGFRRARPNIEVYDPPTSSWSLIPGTVAFKTNLDSMEEVVDAVVW